MVAILYAVESLNRREVQYRPLCFILNVPESTPQIDLLRLITACKPQIFEQHKKQPWSHSVVLSYDLRSTPGVVQAAFEKPVDVPVISFTELQ